MTPSVPPRLKMPTKYGEGAPKCIEKDSQPRGIQVPFVMHSEAFGYVFTAFGFLAITKTLCLVDFSRRECPTKYPYYNINRGELRWRDAAHTSCVQKVLSHGDGF